MLAIVQGVAAQPAPPLTELYVYAVASEQGGIEYISSSQVSTLENHGGAWMYVYTVEIGYGTGRIAKMNTVSLTEASSQPITDSSSIIVGWFRAWDASGFDGGNFTYQSRSINYPHNTMSTSLFIR